MPRGPSEHVVTKFLQHALAAHALGVTELDAKARAAGLLGEHQSITTAKVIARSKNPAAKRELRRGAAGAGARTSHSGRRRPGDV